MFAQVGHSGGFRQLLAKHLATNLLVASSNFPRLNSLKNLLLIVSRNFLVIHSLQASRFYCRGILQRHICSYVDYRKFFIICVPNG